MTEHVQVSVLMIVVSIMVLEVFTWLAFADERFLAGHHCRVVREHNVGFVQMRNWGVRCSRIRVYKCDADVYVNRETGECP
jgi:hypothetical protein